MRIFSSVKKRYLNLSQRVKRLGQIAIWITKSVGFNLIYLIMSPFYQFNKNIIGFANEFFNGNPRIIYDHLRKQYPDLKLYFVSDNIKEITRLHEMGIESYYFIDIQMIPLFLETSVWITDHGYFYIPGSKVMNYFHMHKAKWVDTWHGVGVEHASGIGRAKMLKSYDIGFISSEFFMEYYESKQKGISDKLRITGYPRTDPLLNGSLNKKWILKSMDIPEGKQIILYAPSWGNPAVGETSKKPFFPFSDPESFFSLMELICQTYHCLFIIRLHPNWEKENPDSLDALKKIIVRYKCFTLMPFRDYPETENFLVISDILITDYSSIANDFLLLNRPIIFLDTQLNNDLFIFPLNTRGGITVRNHSDLKNELTQILIDPDYYSRNVMNSRQEYIQKIYKYDDPYSTDRCIEEIVRLLP